jgi:putative membrane protein
MFHAHNWSWRSGWSGGSPERLVELVVRWLILSLAVWVAASLVSGIRLAGWQSTLAIALILGLLNLYVRPLLVALSLPITVLTLGLFLIVINAGLLYFASWLVERTGHVNFRVDGFGAALLGALVISAVSFLAGIFINPRAVARTLNR